jgi:hypothetical protein
MPTPPPCIDMLPFSREDFVAVFAQYNAALGPLQSTAPLLGLVLVAFLAHPSARHARFVGIGLGALWIWTGVVYHGLFFARINAAAWGFGALFVLQGALLWHAVWKDGFRLAPAADAGGIVGWALIAYAVGPYALVGLLSGQPFDELPAFGLTPCPLTLTTLGCLLMTVAPTPRRLRAIPLLWSAIGGSAAWILAMPQDWPLLAGGVAAGAWWWVRRGSRPTPHAALADRARTRSTGERPDPSHAASH